MRSAIVVSDETAHIEQLKSALSEPYELRVEDDAESAMDSLRIAPADAVAELGVERHTGEREVILFGAFRGFLDLVESLVEKLQ